MLKNLRKASARFHREKFAMPWRDVLEKNARRCLCLPDTRGSHKGLSCSQLMSTQSQRRRQGRPPSHPPSRCQAQSQTRDRAVTAGALSHGTTAAHGCRLTACARTSPPARSIWPRWRASAHNGAGGWLQTRIAKQVRATLGDAPVVLQGRLFTCLPQAGSSLPWPEHLCCLAIR